MTGTWVPALPQDASPDTLAALDGAARCHGTPLYAYDLPALQRRWDTTRGALPPGVRLHYSLKANPSLGLAAALAAAGAGVEVGSLGELMVALQAGFAPRDVIVSGPHKHPQLVERLLALPEALVSVDSLDELASLPPELPCRLLVRLRPDFATPAAIPLGERFGVPLEALAGWPSLQRVRARVAGFHVHAGSQLLDADAVTVALGSALDLACEAAARTGVEPEVIDVGGGFGVPYEPADRPLDLSAVATAVGALARRAAPATLVLELGRYLVAECGWYVTRVLGAQQREGRPAVVVDGGTHQRPDLCQLQLSRRSAPPLVVAGARAGEPTPTDILGSLCLPDDVLAEAVPLPALAAGAVLAFPRAGAYGFTGAPSRFLSHPEPAEVAFSGTATTVLRPRGEPGVALRGQRAEAGPGSPLAPLGQAG